MILFPDPLGLGRGVEKIPSAWRSGTQGISSPPARTGSLWGSYTQPLHHLGYVQLIYALKYVTVCKPGSRGPAPGPFIQSYCWMQSLLSL